MTERPKDLGRRDLFGIVAGLAAAPLAAIRCGAGSPPKNGLPEESIRVRIPVSDLADGRRKVVLIGPNPVEVRRGPSGLEARMLRCTHSGCIVRWKEAENAYLCPCHEGRYDPDGRVVAGPPPLPLRAVPIRVASGVAVVG